MGDGLVICGSNRVKEPYDLDVLDALYGSRLKFFDSVNAADKYLEEYRGKNRRKVDLQWVIQKVCMDEDIIIDIVSGHLFDFYLAGVDGDVRHIRVAYPDDMRSAGARSFKSMFMHYINSYIQEYDGYYAYFWQSILNSNNHELILGLAIGMLLRCGIKHKNLAREMFEFDMLKGYTLIHDMPQGVVDELAVRYFDCLGLTIDGDNHWAKEYSYEKRLSASQDVQCDDLTWEEQIKDVDDLVKLMKRLDKLEKKVKKLAKKQGKKLRGK